MFSKLTNKLPSISKVFLRRYSKFIIKPCTSSVPVANWSVLPNGLKVIAEETRSPLACVSMLIQTGPMHEAAYNNGITYFIERMAFKGTANMRREILEERISSIGANLDCKTTREYQIFTATCLTDFTNDMIEIFANILTSIDFSSMECEYKEIAKETENVENNPKQLCFDYLHQTAFQGTNLGFPVIGPLKNFYKFTESYTKSYIKEVYIPSRIVIAFSGNLAHEQVVIMTTKWFGMLEDPNYEYETHLSRFTGSQVIFRHDGLPYSHNAVAVEAPGYLDHNYLTFRLLVEILGSWDKSQGTGYRMWPGTAQFSACADLCDRYEAFYIPYKNVGLFGVYFVAANGKFLDDMMYNVQTHMMQLCSTLQKADVERAKNRLKFKLAKELNGCKNSCLDMAVQMNYYGLRKTLNNLWDTVSYISVAQCKSVADQYIFDKCIACANVGPTESFPDYIRVRSGMYWLRM